eukprot:755857-Hanusia_phi.AAC.3
MLSEEQNWYRDYVEEHGKRKKEKDPLDDDYWSEDEGQEGQEEQVQSFSSQRWEEMFSNMGNSLQQVRALRSDVSDWIHVGGRRRMGKQVWHCWRMFSRCSKLHHHGIRMRMIAGIDIFDRLRKEPNFGVRRKIVSPAARDFWYRHVVPKVLAANTNMEKRSVPCLHPNKIEHGGGRVHIYPDRAFPLIKLLEMMHDLMMVIAASISMMSMMKFLISTSIPPFYPSLSLCRDFVPCSQEVLACRDAVTQAPIGLLAEEMIRYFNLNREERIVLPYLLGSGCCDYHHGGNFTFGVDPCCYADAMHELKEKLSEFEASGSHLETRKTGKGAEAERAWKQFVEEVETRRTMIEDAAEASQEFIDCKQLQVIIDYW